MVIDIMIPGTPIAQKRPRFARRGKFVTTYSDQETEAGKFYLEARSQIMHLEGLPCTVPVRLDIGFFFPWPASASTKKRIQPGAYRHRKKPDTDNLIKFVFDCLNGLIYQDDAQVWSVYAFKRYSDTPRTEISIDTQEV